MGKGRNRKGKGGKRQPKVNSRSPKTGTVYTSAVREGCSSGKWAWHVAAEARSAVRSMKRMGDRAVRAYLCPECSRWHVGHLPRAVREGRISVADYYGDGDEATG
jgi:hypothetical protein